MSKLDVFSTLAFASDHITKSTFKIQRSISLFITSQTNSIDAAFRMDRTEAKQTSTTVHQHLAIAEPYDVRRGQFTVLFNGRRPRKSILSPDEPLGSLYQF